MSEMEKHSFVNLIVIYRLFKNNCEVNMGMPSRTGGIYLECILRGGKNFFI